MLWSRWYTFFEFLRTSVLGFKTWVDPFGPSGILKFSSKCNTVSIEAEPFDPLSNYRPQTKFAKVMFLQVSNVCRGAMRGCSQGGCAWLLQGGHAWLLLGGHAWLLWEVCMVALGQGIHWLLPGGMRGCSGGGMHGYSQGGRHGCSWGHAWLLRGGMCGFFDEIRSMSGRYASYWNAFLLNIGEARTHVSVQHSVRHPTVLATPTRPGI